MTQALRYALVVGSAIASILLFLLASASNNSVFFAHNITWLLGMEIGVAVALLVLVLVAFWRLYSRYKAGKFGSRLMVRLMLLFAGIGILPGLVVFMVSVQFVSHSIESWFDVKIEAALDSGLNLSRAALDEALADLSANAGTVAATLAGQGDQDVQAILARALDDRPRATAFRVHGRRIPDQVERVDHRGPGLRPKWRGRVVVEICA